MQGLFRTLNRVINSLVRERVFRWNPLLLLASKLTELGLVYSDGVAIFNQEAEEVEDV
jgi:hypothetical protein